MLSGLQPRHQQIQQAPDVCDNGEQGKQEGLAVSIGGVDRSAKVDPELRWGILTIQL